MTSEAMLKHYSETYAGCATLIWSPAAEILWVARIAGKLPSYLLFKLKEPAMGFTRQAAVLPGSCQAYLKSV